MTYTMSDILPHKDPMILIDHVVEHKKDFIHTNLTIREGIPFYENNCVPSYIAIEYMAQSIAAWNGIILWKTKEKPRIGFLLGTRKMTLRVPAFYHGSVLDIYGFSKFTSGEIGSFECWIKIDGERVVESNLTVFQPKGEKND